MRTTQLSVTAVNVSICWEHTNVTVLLDLKEKIVKLVGVKESFCIASVVRGGFASVAITNSPNAKDLKSIRK